MTIQTKKENASLVISLGGRLDTVTAPELEKCVTEQLDGVSDLIFDLKELTYTSSAGLRVFLKAQKLMNSKGSMKLIHTAPSVMEIFEMTGFCDILTIEADS